MTTSPVAASVQTPVAAPSAPSNKHLQLPIFRE